MKLARGFLPAVCLLMMVPAFAQPPKFKPSTSRAVAADISSPVRTLPVRTHVDRWPNFNEKVFEIRSERGAIAKNKGYDRDGAIQPAASRAISSIPAPILTFEGLNNLENPFLVAPPDPNSDVGPNHIVEMVNLLFAVYDKAGNTLAGPTQVGDLWANFAIPDCSDLSGDPVVLYDPIVDRWLLSQFTTRGPIYYNCVAISVTPDPTGPFYRYAFSTKNFFPDYPKYGVWNNSYVITTREFGPTVEYGIGIYALEKSKMLTGNPAARSMRFFLSATAAGANLIGDGLLPADIDGTSLPDDSETVPVVGSQDNGGGRGASIDGLNIWELTVNWSAGTGSVAFNSTLPIAPYDTIFPCVSTSRDCIPQPDTTRRIDILSYRQRPLFRLAFRKFGDHESMVTNQSVEAFPSTAGIRWWEIRRTNGAYSLFQEGTYVKGDGVHRWMGSIAMDKQGNMGLGYSVAGNTTFPGIRYTGRLSTDPLGMMSNSEGTIIDGTGSQTTSSRRWGDYTSMSVDPVDDCTFWYTDEYYQTTSSANWQTRIGSFKMPGCE